MSDITLRFDGIFLLLALGLGAIGYVLIAIGAGLTALASPARRRRAWRVAAAAAAMGLSTILAGTLFVFYWTDIDTDYGPDWLDWMIVPWALVFAAGCWVLTRV